MADLACDPHLEARAMLARIALRDGTPLRVPGSPIHVDGRTPTMSRGPRLGEHACAVLEMSRFGVMTHLRVLEDASLIVTRRSGR